MSCHSNKKRATFVSKSPRTANVNRWQPSDDHKGRIVLRRSLLVKIQVIFYSSFKNISLLQPGERSDIEKKNYSFKNFANFTRQTLRVSLMIRRQRIFTEIIFFKKIIPQADRCQFAYHWNAGRWMSLMISRFISWPPVDMKVIINSRHFRSFSLSNFFQKMKISVCQWVSRYLAAT